MGNLAYYLRVRNTSLNTSLLLYCILICLGTFFYKVILFFSSNSSIGRLLTKSDTENRAHFLPFLSPW